MSIEKRNGQQPTNPWDRLPAETDTAYHRFSIYLNLGPDRSLMKVGQKLGKNRAYKKQLEKWSSKYNWTSRAVGFDEHLQTQVVENKVEVIKAVQEKILQQADELVDNLFRIARSEAPDRMEAIQFLFKQAGLSSDQADEAPKGSVLQQFNEIIHNYHNRASNGYTNND